MRIAGGVFVVVISVCPFSLCQEMKPLPKLSLADAILVALPHANERTRFLWLGDVEPDNLGVIHGLIYGHTNHLSTESDLVPPSVVRGSAGQLLVINVDDYGPAFAASWEKLGGEEPYFHVRVKVAEVQFKVIERSRVWPGGVWEDGKFYPKGSFLETWREKIQVSQGEPKVRAALAPWLAKSPKHKKAISELFARAKSQTPIVSGQWFLWQTGAQQDRSPGYYDFLGIQRLADLEALAGFDAKVAAAARRKELLEAVALSGVARQPRRIGSFPALDRRLWKTFDSSLATEKHNPLRVLDSDNFKFDASEIFYGLPNGLWGFGLFAANGDRQNTAPDFIGPDTTSTSNDGRIHAGISCIRCHYPNGGLNPLDGWARNLFKAPLQLYGVTPEIERDLRQKYLRDLEGPMENDRKGFERALKQITGMEPKKYAEAFRNFWWTYETPRTTATAAREIGVTKDVFRKCLLAYLKDNGTIDPVLGAFLRDREVPIYQWFEVYSQAQEIVAAYEKEFR